MQDYLRVFFCNKKIFMCRVENFVKIHGFIVLVFFLPLNFKFVIKSSFLVEGQILKVFCL